MIIKLPENFQLDKEICELYKNDTGASPYCKFLMSDPLFLMAILNDKEKISENSEILIKKPLSKAS